MIKMKGRVMTFTGKDSTIIRKHAKEVGMTVKDFVIGILWEQIMREARAGKLLKKGK